MERGPDDGGGGGNGPAGPPPRDTLTDRVEKLEAGQAAILAKLEAIAASIAEARLENEKRFSKFEVSLTKLEERLTHTATTAALTAAISDEHKDLNSRIATIDGRLSSIPTTLQTVGIIVGMLVGLSGVAFTLSKATESARQPPIVTPAPAPAPPALTAPAAPVPALPPPKAP